MKKMPNIKFLDPGLPDVEDKDFDTITWTKVERVSGVVTFKLEL
jgi:hypothetical protein